MHHTRLHSIIICVDFFFFFFCFTLVLCNSIRVCMRAYMGWGIRQWQRVHVVRILYLFILYKYIWYVGGDCDWLHVRMRRAPIFTSPELQMVNNKMQRIRRVHKHTRIQHSHIDAIVTDSRRTCRACDMHNARCCCCTTHRAKCKVNKHDSNEWNILNVFHFFWRNSICDFGWRVNAEAIIMRICPMRTHVTSRKFDYVANRCVEFLFFFYLFGFRFSVQFYSRCF